MAKPIEQSIYNTIRYFDIFDLPITATQIWQCLIVGPPTAGIRWEGHRQYSLQDIVQALDESAWLQQRLGSMWGYFFLSDKHHLVHTRLRRHVRAQQKWKILQRVTRVLAIMPFVRSLAGSGSLAWDNTTPDSDLDVFVITKAKRIWTARLFLLFASHIMGRRRKYWNRKAPDKVCLNHYITDEELIVPAQVRNLYTAVQYVLFIPIAGLHLLSRFHDENAAWIRPYVMAPDFPRAGHMYAVKVSSWTGIVKRAVESFLLEPVGDLVEQLAEAIQRRTITRHTMPGRSGRVALSNRELAFHPDTKVPAILAQFEQDPDQKRLL